MAKLRPIRFIMLGGFLGSGKTTALLRLARHYGAQGLRVGVITNDQAEGLVDTLTFREAGFTTEEIPSGCFCCHFEKLIEASGRLADGLAPDIILAEPVGSCTDLVNAVITPLKAVYADRFVVAPYAVLLDPFRAEEALGASGPTGFSKKVTYLFKMQQNEADIVAINKIDQLSPDGLKRVEALVAQNFPKATAIGISAREGTGFDPLIALLDGDSEPGRNPVDVDYAAYTEGEIALGWLNAHVALQGDDTWDGNDFLESVGHAVQEAMITAGTQIAHFKMRLVDEAAREAALHSTANDMRSFATTRRLPHPITRATLTINLRAEGHPDLLRESVEKALTESAADCAVILTTMGLQAFAPSPPVPPPASRSQVAH